MNTMAEHRGPVMASDICQWLDKGGPFPSTIKVLVPGVDDQPQELNYEILDRDQDGIIASLRTGRRGKKGFVLRVREPTSKREIAAKLCIPADYDDPTSPIREIDHATQLKGGEEFIQLVTGVGRVAPFDGQPESDDLRPWVCFLSDWLPGRTLQDVLDDPTGGITPGLVAEIAETLLRAVLFLEKRGLKHDDLHLGNLMLMPNDPDLLEIDPQAPKQRLKVIDLGSLKPIERPTFKGDDDWSSVAKCLAQLHNVLHQDRGIASRYPHFLRRLAEFIQDLSDEDPCRHFPAASSYLARIREAADTLTILPRNDATFHPFDAISAEHLANDELLLDLFVGHLPWISLVQTPEPTVLIGPRGCGKSMVFRYLSIRTHISSTAASPEILKKLGFFGVYIGCASDLGNDLLWIAREKGRPERWADSITTYFNLVLTRELLRSLALCGRATAVANALGLTDRARTSIADYIQDELGDQLDLIRLRGMDPLQTCADVIDRLRLKLSRDLLEGREPGFKLPQTFLRELCQRVIAAAPGFEQWRIVFLLDDYTSHRLSKPVQYILNAILWQRTATHVFKVSSEPHGFEAGHVDKARIDANREYVPIDAGELTIENEREADRREFITKLINKRLGAAKYKGTAQQLIGNSDYRSDPELATHIRAKKGDRSGQRSYYQGLHVLSNAWSGDVATVLHMVREMFARADIKSDVTTTIPAHIQHKSIVKVSTALRDRVSGYHPYGAEMAKILAASGDLARRLLIDAPDRKNREGALVIHRKYRLEMSLPVGADLEAELLLLPGGEHMVSVMHELVRRAIFVQLSASRGKEDAARRTLRWQLRSSLLPSFGTSLVRKNYIDVKRIEDFAELLTNPDKFAEKAYLRYAPTRGGDLFGDLRAEENDE